MSIYDFDRDTIIERYVTDIVGNLDFLETKEVLKDRLMKEKYLLSDDELEFEISQKDPSLLSDMFIEEILEGVYHA